MRPPGVRRLLDLSQSHVHHHGQAHVHAPATLGAAFAWGISLNTAFVLAELVYGFRAGSLALIADAGHNFGDVLGLALVWWTRHLARRSPTPRHTYGLGRSTILSALANAGLLILGVGALLLETVQRLFHAQAVEGATVIWVAGVGVVINGVTAMFFFADRKNDLNVRSAYVHMASDAVISLGVVISGALMLTMRWYWLDPVMSLAICALLLWSTWGLLRESLLLAVDAVPPGIEPRQVELYLAGLPCVSAVHDLHIWAMSTTDTALTAHLVMSDVPQSDELLLRASRELQERFKIQHMTIQFEHGDGEVPCGQTHHAKY